MIRVELYLLHLQIKLTCLARSPRSGSYRVETSSLTICRYADALSRYKLYMPGSHVALVIPIKPEASIIVNLHAARRPIALSRYNSSVQCK